MISYQTLINTIKIRGKRFLKDTINNDDGVIFEAVNSVVVDLAATIKTLQGKADIAVVNGTRDYTIATAVAADCDKILYLYKNSVEVSIKYLSVFEANTLWLTGGESDNGFTDPPFARVWSGVLRLFPTPNANYTLTAYYIKSVPKINATNDLSGVILPFEDRYFEGILNSALAVLAESAGDYKAGQYYMIKGEEKISNAFGARPTYDGDAAIVPHDGLG